MQVSFLLDSGIGYYPVQYIGTQLPYYFYRASQATPQDLVIYISSSASYIF